MISHHHASGLFAKACHTLLERGCDMDRRGKATIEVPYPVTMALTTPTNYVCLNPARKLNPWVMLAEFPWIMCGRSDVAWLVPYLPRAVQFSDDGMVWRAGYGPRMMKWNGGTVWDQVAEVIHRLSEDGSTRQAIISLWDPARDNVEGSKDYPCTQTIHFQRNQNGDLDCIVHMRSNDLVWGASGVNIPNFCLLQCYVAEALDWGVGKYYHIADNLHIYERHFSLLEYAALAPDEWGLGEHPDFLSTMGYSGLEFHNAMKGVFGSAMHTVDHYRQRHTFPIEKQIVATHIHNRCWVHSYPCEWAHFMLLHDMVMDTPRRRHMEKEKPDGAMKTLIAGHLEDVGYLDWRIAAAAWLHRNSEQFRDVAQESLAASMGAMEAARHTGMMDQVRG